MDLDTSHKEDGSLFLVEEHCNLHENEVEERGQGLDDQEKIMEETIQVCELTNSPASPIGINSEEQQSPALLSNSDDKSSLLIKTEGQEQQLHVASDFDKEAEKKCLVDSTETLNCIEKEESSNYGKLLDCDSGEILKTDGELPDSKSYFENHDTNYRTTESDLHQSGDGTSVTLLVNCQSVMSEHDNEQMAKENNRHDAELKVDHTQNTMNSCNGQTPRENSIVESPSTVQEEELLSSVDPQFTVPMEGSPPTIPHTIEEQMPPENDHGESAVSPKHVIGSESFVDALVNSSPSAQKQRLSPSPERQLSVPLNTSSDARIERQDQLHHENGVRKFARSPRHTTPEKNTIGSKRASSHERLSPSKRHKSPLGSVTCQDAHRKDYSPRRRESPRRRDRRTSRSPERKDSSGHRRGNNVEPRSRSPYSRDNYKRRGKNSPRRRSPPPTYNSHRRSPRRPWSPPRNRNTGVGRPGKNLFVAGFSYATTERDLEKKFSRFGRVRDVRIVRDKRSGDSRGFGFLSLETDEDADAAIRAIDQTEWNGRIVLVEKTKTSAH